MMLLPGYAIIQRCQDDWHERWLATLDESWHGPLRWQLQAMFPHRCFCWNADCNCSHDRYSESSLQARCQKWFHFAANVRDIPTHLRNEVLGQYERELYPELCE